MHPNTFTQRPAQVLRAAARYLAEHGWIQGARYQDVPGALHPKADTLGAIGLVVHGQCHKLVYDRALPGRQVVIEAVQALHDHLYEVYPWWEAYELGHWNDGARTAQEVIAALGVAADRWDRRHGGAA